MKPKNMFLPFFSPSIYLFLFLFLFLSRCSGRGFKPWGKLFLIVVDELRAVWCVQKKETKEKACS